MMIKIAADAITSVVPIQYVLVRIVNALMGGGIVMDLPVMVVKQTCFTIINIAVPVIITADTNPGVIMVSVYVNGITGTAMGSRAMAARSI